MVFTSVGSKNSSNMIEQTNTLRYHLASSTSLNFSPPLQIDLILHTVALTPSPTYHLIVFTATSTNIRINKQTAWFAWIVWYTLSLVRVHHASFFPLSTFTNQLLHVGSTLDTIFVQNLGSNLILQFLYPLLHHENTLPTLTSFITPEQRSFHSTWICPLHTLQSLSHRVNWIAELVLLQMFSMLGSQMPGIMQKQTSEPTIKH